MNTVFEEDMIIFSHRNSTVGASPPTRIKLELLTESKRVAMNVSQRYDDGEADEPEGGSPCAVGGRAISAVRG